MRRTALAIALCVLIAPASALAGLLDVTAKPPDSTYRVPASYGVEGEVRIYRDAPLTVCVIRLSSKGLSLAAKNSRQSGDKRAIFEESVRASDVVVTSGGFFGFDTEGKLIPLGLLIEEGRPASRQIKKWTTGGMLVQGADGIRIVRVADYKPEPAPTSAIQSKPLIVMGGLNDMPAEDSKISDRIAVGLMSGGDVLIAAVFADAGLGGTNLYRLAELMRSMGVASAIALDGGPSAHIYIPWLKLHIGYTGPYYVPNTLHFKSTGK